MQARIKVMVVDDVKVERQVLRVLVESHPVLHWVGEADNAEAAAEMIEARQPDVLFLDVQMPERDGFELLRKLEAPPKVVFVSAWASYAVQAFTVEAVDFLRKPVAPQRFAATVERLRRVFAEESEQTVRHETNDRLCLRTTESTVILPLPRISALVADGDFTRVLLADDPPLLACRRLGDFDNLLPAPPFVRLDRSLVINRDRVLKLERLARDSAKLRLKGLDEPLVLGRTAMERLRELIK